MNQQQSQFGQFGGQLQESPEQQGQFFVFSLMFIFLTWRETGPRPGSPALSD